jgi:Zn-dependent metalloprotease
LDYLVDAHDGSVVYYYSVTPTAKSQPRALPGRFRGLDDEGKKAEFDGLVSGKLFQLIDPQRRIKTLDFGRKDIDEEPITLPDAVSCTTFDFGGTTPAAISAHVNSTHVFKFYNEVLIRRGVDDQNSELVNVVNCISSVSENPPNWNNAVWWNGKMWYGQQKVKGTKDRYSSYARYLDIIAHELTHGVTEHTCNLVYRDEAGALNESFSDIFGVIINNWTRKGADSDPRTWDWIIGAGLGEKPGSPLRSMKDPKITGDPDHMDDYKRLAPTDDFGGVHTNSNIHNKAAYNLLVAVDAKKKLVIPARDVARMYYFTLQRLDRVATFRDVLDTMLDVAKTMYPDPAEAAPKLAAIRAAYGAVGIGPGTASAQPVVKKSPAKKGKSAAKRRGRSGR